jgi:glyoxylate reductase
VSPKPVIVASAPFSAETAAGLRTWAELIAGPNDEPLPPAEVASQAAATGLLIETTTRVDEKLLERLPNLRIVATSAVGYDNIDLAACTRRGIAVSNGRGSLDDAVADLAFALVLMCRRHVLPSLAWAKSGAWQRAPAPFGHDVAGATLGIYGLGAIGLALAKRARASGMTIEYHNRRQRPDDAATGATYRDLPDLVRRCDVLVILTPLTPQTRKRFSAELLALFRPSAYLVNVARGAIVDLEALTAALEAGRLAGAALDVTDPEPLDPAHPLYAMPNVIVTPHVGSATVETRERMSRLAAQNLTAFFRGDPLLTPVE